MAQIMEPATGLIRLGGNAYMLRAWELYASLENTGGFSVNCNLEPHGKTNGYFASMAGWEFKLPRDVNFSQFRDALVGASVGARNLPGKDWHIGAWIDGNHLYIDVSKWHAGRDEALAFGFRNAQLAIFDVAHGESIYLQ